MICEEITIPLLQISADEVFLAEFGGDELRHLVVPGTQFKHAYKSSSELLDRLKPSTNSQGVLSQQKIDQEVIDLADFLGKRTKSSVLVKGIPERDENK